MARSLLPASLVASLSLTTS